jgi:hypothetical protein
MPLIIPSNSITGGYEVANSLRFNDGSNDYLNRTFGSSGNTKKFTVSFWFKLGIVPDGTSINTIGSGTDNTNDFMIGFSYDASRTTGIHILARNSGTKVIDVQTNRKFRDLSAWYHAVISIDTTQSTDSNRVKIYINNSQETSLLTSTYPSQNTDLRWNTANAHYIGTTRDNQTATNTYDGYMAEVIHINDQQLTPTSFGEFDEDSGIWKPIDVSGLTFGTNGFYLDFEDSAALGDDVSGNGNDFTVNNLTSIDQTTDTPTNNFATMNPLASQSGSGSSSGAFTFSNGNLSVSGITSETGIANFGVSTGKWFWEVKVVTDQNGLAIGACNEGQNLDDELGYQSGSSQANAKVFGYYGDNGNKFTTMGDGSHMTAYGSAIAVNDIVGVAMNLDDNEVTFYLNGSSQDTFSITALGSGEVYFPAVGNYSVATIATDFNFGNPPFTISSGNSDGAGFGQFEYAPPSGYLSLCTKNLATDG